jgi:hypothetical protein
MPRFVVLEHESPRGLHWDFLLEADAVLATWALPEPPHAPHAMLAEALFDHRPAFLEYEGPISGGRGSVRRWDRGTYAVSRRTDDEWVVALKGAKLSGTATLQRLPHDPDRWRFAYQPSAAGD